MFGLIQLTSKLSSHTSGTPCFTAMSSDMTSSPPLGPAMGTENGGGRAGSIKYQLAKLVEVSLRAVFPEESNVQPLIAVCTAKFGDYQCNNAMGIFSKIKGKSAEFKNPNSVGQAIARNLPYSDMIESTSVAGPGFVNIVLSNKWVAQNIQNMLSNGIGAWAPILSVEKAVVDFSSPNIAKEMHVGHLRSTIVGDTISRMLEFSGVEVLRRNHVGDWGTQFGMLIEHLFDNFPDWEDVGGQAIGDLQELYKASKRRFDDDPSFMERAQHAVVRLQGGEARYHNAWQRICEISRREFDIIYQHLDVYLEEKNIPLIVVKRDGGYNYASTDLAALWYRLNIEKAEWIIYVTDVGQAQHFDMVFSVKWIIYVTDVGQAQHFDMVFSAARRAGWLPDVNSGLYPRTNHVGLGLVLGSDGKRFRTRSSEVVRLVEFLDEAKSRSKAELVKRLGDNGKLKEWTDEELEKTAEAVGYGAVKYADLKNNRLTNYTFSFDQMLNDKSGTVVLDHADERILGLHLIQFAEVKSLLLSAPFVFQTRSCCKFITFYHNYFLSKLCDPDTPGKLLSPSSVLGSAEAISLMFDRWFIVSWAGFRICRRNEQIVVVRGNSSCHEEMFPPFGNYSRLQIIEVHFLRQEAKLMKLPM
ncbi:hypothetical protein HPP92_000712 [Vanilla planifolia]|uniref:arginine--tRNA ligase n=1 Tax=Vanilla planifolia TaxID=51239 RepID=A0A835S5E0_VANPL|nr:hypothetical protein HPP92_000712 [Vanilla planifolia]